MTWDERRRYIRHHRHAKLAEMTIPGRDQTMDRYVDDKGDQVEVMQVTAACAEAVALWCSGVPVVEHDALNYSQTYPGINLMTKNGPKRASDGDYVIKHSDGWFEVQKPSEFQYSHWEA